MQRASSTRTSVEHQPILRPGDHGPFDIIGDVHGCLDELIELLRVLGYAVSEQDGHWSLTPPVGRRLVFVGDLVDRGPETPAVLRLVSEAVTAGQALCVPGNHDVRLAKALHGRHEELTYGLRESMDQMAQQAEDFRNRAAAFIDGMPSHLILDGGKLVVAHAGLPEAMHGSSHRTARELAIRGQKTGEKDEYGDIRYPWAREYRGEAMVVYGHTPVAEPHWLNNTVNIDTGCIFGGRLTALRYPELEIVSVAAHRMYFENLRPFLPDDPRIRHKKAPKKTD